MSAVPPRRPVIVGPLSLRVLARLVDATIVAVTASVAVLAFGPLTRTGQLWATTVAASVTVIVYDIVCLSTTGATIGKALLRLRVMDLTRPGHRRLRVRVAFLRVLVQHIGQVAGWVVWAAGPVVNVTVYGAALLDRRLRQGLHDRAAGTAVVRDAGSGGGIPEHLSDQVVVAPVESTWEAPTGPSAARSF